MFWIETEMPTILVENKMLINEVITLLTWPYTFYRPETMFLMLPKIEKWRH